MQDSLYYSAVKIKYNKYSVRRANICICSVIIYVHSVIIQCTQCRYAYSHYSAAIYSTDTVPHCIVTLCSPYTVSLCSVNTVSLISLKLYSVHSVTIHAYNVTIQCTHAIMQCQYIYSVHISL